jgi:hypothetical protein
MSKSVMHFCKGSLTLLRRQAGRIKNDDDVGRAVEIALSSLMSAA